MIFLTPDILKSRKADFAFCMKFSTGKRQLLGAKAGARRLICRMLVTHPT
jgi:hypothetical protein